MPKTMRCCAMLAAILLATPLAAAACATPGSLAVARAEVIRLVSAERRRAGLPPVQISGPLQKTAQGQACDIAGRRTTSHRGADGSSLSGRLRKVGYRFRAAAENVARGPGSADAAVDLWMRSAGHRRNILMPQVREAGVGLAVSGAPDARPHWVLVMGTDS